MGKSVKLEIGIIGGLISLHPNVPPWVSGIKIRQKVKWEVGETA